MGKLKELPSSVGLALSQIPKQPQHRALPFSVIQLIVTKILLNHLGIPHSTMSPFFSFLPCDLSDPAIWDAIFRSFSGHALWGVSHPLSTALSSHSLGEKRVHSARTKPDPHGMQKVKIPKFLEWWDTPFPCCSVPINYGMTYWKKRMHHLVPDKGSTLS